MYNDLSFVQVTTADSPACKGDHRAVWDQGEATHRTCTTAPTAVPWARAGPTWAKEGQECTVT